MDASSSGSSRSRSVARHRERLSARVALFRAAFDPRYKPSPGEIVDRSRFVGPGFFPVVSREYGRIRRRQQFKRLRWLRWAKAGHISFISLAGVLFSGLVVKVGMNNLQGLMMMVRVKIRCKRIAGDIII